MSKRRWYEYVAIAIIALCALHVLAHILAWVSTWQYAKYVVCAQLGITLSAMVLSKDKYVHVMYFIVILSMFTWFYMDSIHATYWQFYQYMWATFALVIMCMLAPEK